MFIVTTLGIIERENTALPNASNLPGSEIIPNFFPAPASHSPSTQPLSRVTPVSN